MKWIKNIKNIAASGNVGKCPVCGSDNTDYLCKVIDEKSKNGYMDMWCNKCRSAYHVSRMNIADKMKTVGKVPLGLKY